MRKRRISSRFSFTPGKPRRRILLVDDNATNRRLMRALLENDSLDVIESSHGEEALSILRSEEVDAIISDLVMPVMDGLQFCYNVKKNPKTARIPVIICTSTLTSSSDERTAIAAGADAYLVRPISASDLLTAVHETLTAGKRKDLRRPKRPKAGILKDYTERLVSKLEEKNAELEKRTLELQEEIQERRRAVSAHAAAEQELRSLFAAMTDIVIVLDTKGTYLSIAPTNPRFLFRPSDELIGRSIHDILPQKDADIIQGFLDSAIQSNSPVHVEYRLTINEEEVWFDGTVSPFGPGRVIWIARDITQRRKTEMALVEAHRQLQTLFDNLEEAVFSVDTRSNIMLEASPAHDRIFGYPPQRFFENPRLWYDIAHPDDRERLDRSFDDLLAGRSVTLQYRVTRSDGVERWVEVRMRPTIDESGTLARLDGIASDITTRIETLRELNNQTALARQLFENSPLGIARLDEHIRVVDVNRAFTEIFQYLPSEATGKRLDDLVVPPEERPNAAALLASGVKSHQSRFAAPRLRKDGTRLHVDITVFPIHSEASRNGAYAVYTDVSHRMKLEEQLRKAAKMESLGTLAGGIAHDFNNILGIILGHAGLIEDGDDHPDRRKDSVLKIVRATMRASALVRQLLTFARKGDVTLESIRLNDAVREAMTLLRETLPRSITIADELTEPLPTIVGDANQLHQILINLCVNARDAMPNGGTLSLRTYVTDGLSLRSAFHDSRNIPYVTLEVRDTGIGMDEATKARIFEPFFTTKELGKGTGLGLSTVFGIVQGHEGFVDVDSAIGVGTAFRLYFPVAAPRIELREESPLPLATAPGGTERILVVEDEELLLSSAETLLTSKGYSVRAAKDGAEGLHVFTQHANEIDLVVTDMGMPNLDGRGFIAAIRSLRPDIRVILASGFVEPEEKKRILSEGATWFLQKPYDGASLLRILRETLDRKQ